MRTIIFESFSTYTYYINPTNLSPAEKMLIDVHSLYSYSVLLVTRTWSCWDQCVSSTNMFYVYSYNIAEVVFV
jgi:hypothetical protein